jgi:hypothetical protein
MHATQNWLSNRNIHVRHQLTMREEEMQRTHLRNRFWKLEYAFYNRVLLQSELQQNYVVVFILIQQQQQQQNQVFYYKQQWPLYAEVIKINGIRPESGQLILLYFQLRPAQSNT